MGGGNSTARHHGEQRVQADEQRVDAIYYPLPPRRTSSAAGVGVYPEDILRQFLNYHSVMDYQRAAETALRLIELVPDEPVGHYNYACSMARLRRVDEALTALDQAIECGWRNVDHLRIDPDFALLRDLPAFQNRLDSLEHRVSSEQIAPIPLCESLTETMRAELPSRIDALLAQHRVPGLTLTTIEPDGTSWTYATGVTDAESQSPMEQSSLYRVDDAVDVMLLIAMTQLDDAGIWSTQTMYEQLYAHHMADGDGALDGVAAGHRRVVLPGPDPYRRNHASFRARGMLSLALEHVIGDAVPRYVRTAILEPLRLGDVYFGVLPGDRVPRLAAGHSQFGTPVQLPDRAGLYATSSDLASVFGTIISGSTMPIRDVVDDRELAPEPMIDPSADEVTSDLSMDASETSADLSDLSDMSDMTENADGDSTEHTGQNDDDRAMMRAPLSTTDAWDGRRVLINLRAAKRASPAGLGLAVDLHSTPIGERFILESNDAGMGCLIVGYPRTRRGVVILFNSERGLACGRAIAREILGGV
jgi:CubicO group peptidase (beta-lactamase class C family)